MGQAVPLSLPIAKQRDDTMRAIALAGHGGPEVLQMMRCPRPIPGHGEVLIRVFAAGINRPDVMQRKGIYPPPPGASPLPGLEVAGIVVERGLGVATPCVGQRVCALLSGGGYAEYCVADAALCLPIPQGLTAVQAASLPETSFTVWSNVFERAALRSGETVLVHGGSSGIGVMAIQMARAFGSRVLVTAGSQEKCEACLRLGAEIAIAYRTDDFVAEVLRHTQGRGVDVILDMVGGDYLQRNVSVLAEDGRLVHINAMSASRATVSLRDIMVKRLTITGSTLRARPVAVKASIAAALLREVWPRLEYGDIRPVVQHVFPLDQAGAAHALMERGDHIGKIVLDVCDQGEAA